MAESHQKRILFTNLCLSTRSGSELHVLELATAFIERGWQVDCYTLVASWPLQGELLKIGARVIEFDHEDDLAPSYDVLFAQHRMVSDYLIGLERISFKAVIVSILGLGDMESMPRFANQVDAFVFVSQEAQDFALKVNPSLQPKQTFVFPNSATQPYFDYSSATTSDEKNSKLQPQKIAVISNHVPQELYDMTKAIDSSASIAFYGVQHTSVPITPEFLAEHDIVITIGRTVIQAMALGIPVFIYDHFGGPGYLTPNILDKAAYHNFSGRDSKRHEEGATLWKEIKDGYAAAQKSATQFREYAGSARSFNRNFQELSTLIINVSSRNELHTLKADWETGQKWDDFVLCSLYRSSIQNGTIGQAQVYWSDSASETLSEEQSAGIPYRYDTDIVLCPQELAPQDCVIKRFDPDNKACRVTISANGYTPINSSNTIATTSSAKSLFYTADPMYHIDEDSSNIITFATRPMHENELLDHILHQTINLNSLTEKLNIMKLQNETMALQIAKYQQNAAQDSMKRGGSTPSALWRRCINAKNCIAKKLKDIFSK